MALAAASFLAPQAFGQPVLLPACSQGMPRFCADAAYFLDGDSYTLEVYVGICNEALQFVRTKGGYRASADVMVLVLDDTDKQVAGDTYRIRLHSSTYDKTTSVDSCETRVVRFRAAPGDFKMTIAVSDRDSHRKTILNAEIDVPDLTGGRALSDIVFLTEEPGPKHEKWPGFRPNVKRVYSDVGKSVVFFYELYRMGLEDSVKVLHEVFDDENSRVYGFSSVSAGDRSLAYLERIPVDSLSNGTYTLRVSMMGQEGKPVAARSKQFEVSTDVLYLGRDLDEAVALLYYIADSSFIDRLVNADPDERKTLWEQFWREKDPTPSTPRNEFYEEHLRRFKYANQHFRSSVAEGWRTDRGRIYITYGPPDEIDSGAMELDADPTEIWYYFENGRRFVFVDETGFGDYVLVSAP